MNRLRQHNNIYQVLVTPYKTSLNDGLVDMLGNWTDDHLRGYCIKEYDNMEDALEEAFNYPDLDWDRLSTYHKDAYGDLYRRIKTNLNNESFIYDIEPVMMSGEQIKNVMFDRVDNMGSRFSLTYNLNDVIGYHIVNPWTKNLKEMIKVFKNDKKLRITRMEETNGIIRLIGLTDLSTNYEIVLWPTIIFHWAKWMAKHDCVPDKSKANALKDALKTQEMLDKTLNIR